MTINDYLQQLVHTDLHNLRLTDEAGSVKAAMLPVLLGLVQAGIRTLSTRFYLSESYTKTMTLPQGVHEIDLAQTLTDGHDVLALVGVYVQTILPHLAADTLMAVLPKSRQQLEQLRLLSTTTHGQESCLEPCYHQHKLSKIWVFSPYPSASYTLVCRMLLGASQLQLTDQMPLPEVYHNALGLYIASRLLRSMDNGMDNDVNESTRYYQAYQQEVQLLDQQGIELDRQPQDTLFFDRGFI